MQLQFVTRYGTIVPNYARKKYFHGVDVIGDATGRPQKCPPIFICKSEMNFFRDNTMEHNTTEDNTMEHNTTQQSTTQQRTQQRSTTQQRTQHNSVAQHNGAQHNGAQHSTMEHSTTEQNTLPVCLLWWICQSRDSRFALVWTRSLCTPRQKTVGQWQDAHSSKMSEICVWFLI